MLQNIWPLVGKFYSCCDIVHIFSEFVYTMYIETLTHRIDIIRSEYNDVSIPT